MKGDLVESKTVEMDSILFQKYRKGFFLSLRDPILYRQQTAECWFGKDRLQNKNDDGKQIFFSGIKEEGHVFFQ